MEFTLRALTMEERKYTYAQSMQLESQTGSIGRLRGDFGSGGQGFYTTWYDHRPQWKSKEFMSEFDDVINALRTEEYGLLSGRQEMAKFARVYRDSSFQGNYTTEYGFRIDTKEHAYLLRCIPVKGDYNFYCFCYVSQWLDRHMEQARQDIRFIDSGYRDLFRLPDGAQIVISCPDGQTLTRACRYIDQTHLEVGDQLYHICEFAERMERNGNTYAPKEPPLPPKCFSTLPSSGELIVIDRYQSGYTPGRIPEGKDAKETAEQRNRLLGVSKAQEAAMLAGSLFGWDTPAAKPKNYDENGCPLKPKKKDYER